MAEHFDLTLDSLGAHGDGVGTHEGEAVFVPFTLPGDTVTAVIDKKNRNGIFANLVSVNSASPDRAAPACKHFGICGGCQLQFMKPEIYAHWVKERAVMALAHHGFDAGLVLDPVVTPPGSRRRVALKALKTVQGVVLGFNERQSHRVVDARECPVTRPELTALFAPLRPLLKDLLDQAMSATVHMTMTHAGVDMLIDAPKALDLAARETLVSFAEQYDLASLHWQDQGFLDPVAIRREPVMHFAGALVPLPPAAFVQATQEGETALIEAVLAACDGYKRVADLFSGIGTFTFPLARHHQVLTVEGAKNALDALTVGLNAAHDSFKQIIPLHRDLYRRPMTAKELQPFEAVVFDPPRAGAKEQVAELAKSGVKRIVAVSCNPNTFSRDARLLVDGGYVLDSVLPVDQFLWSAHLELVGVFTRA